jgi:hypothetical protein
VTAQTEEQFIQAENDWDLERLYNALTAVKGKNLTRIEFEVQVFYRKNLNLETSFAWLIMWA